MTSQLVDIIQGIAILLLAITCIIQDRTNRRMVDRNKTLDFPCPPGE